MLSRMLSSPRWFIAVDADEAGDKSAAKFPASAIRVRPPDTDKDWGGVHAGGFNRIRYHWGRQLRLSKSWEELESLQWGTSSRETRHREPPPSSIVLADHDHRKLKPGLILQIDREIIAHILPTEKAGLLDSESRT